MAKLTDIIKMCLHYLTDEQVTNMLSVDTISEHSTEYK